MTWHTFLHYAETVALLGVIAGLYLWQLAHR